MSIKKRFLKRNLADVGMSQCMNALADKVHKQEVPCTQWYARELCNMATLFNHLLRSATHLLVVDASSSNVCTDGCHPAASMLCLLSLYCKKVQAVSPSYTQSKAQMNHPQRISWLLVAISNATCIAFMVLGWLKKEERKKERRWTILTSTFSGLPL